MRDAVGISEDLDAPWQARHLDCAVELGQGSLGPPIKPYNGATRHDQGEDDKREYDPADKGE